MSQSFSQRLKFIRDVIVENFLWTVVTIVNGLFAMAYSEVLQHQARFIIPLVSSSYSECLMLIYLGHRGLLAFGFSVVRSIGVFMSAFFQT